MSRLDALDQYNKALGRGKKYYNAHKNHGEDPHPKVLEEFVRMASVRSVPVGIVEIPINRIVGTFSGSRKDVCDGLTVPPLEELLRLDWLCDNVEGSIPSVEELLPETRDLVRQLGIHSCKSLSE